MAENRLPYNEVVPIRGMGGTSAYIFQKKVCGALPVVYGGRVSKGGAYYANEGGSRSHPFPPPSFLFSLTLPSPIKGATGRLLAHTYKHKPSLSLSCSLPLFPSDPPFRSCLGLLSPD